MRKKGGDLFCSVIVKNIQYIWMYVEYFIYLPIIARIKYYTKDEIAKFLLLPIIDLHV
jgi:hypothetical protein